MHMVRLAQEREITLYVWFIPTMMRAAAESNLQKLPISQPDGEE